MSELRKANTHRPFIITFPVVGWIDVFTRHDYCEEFLRNLEYCSYTAKRLIDMIINNSEESRKEWLLYMFKFSANNTSQNSEYQFWQKTSYPTELFTSKVFDQKREYIHQNPVKAMLVNDETSYVYSSANPDSPFIVDES